MWGLSFFSPVFFGNLVFIAGLFLAVLLSVFLYWREGRRELVDSHILFDSLLLAAVFGFLGSRLFSFFINYKEFNFSLSKLLFFHLFPGYSFYGAIVGLLIGGAVYLRRQRVKTFWLFDLATPALAFGQAVIALTLLLWEKIVNGNFSLKYLEYFLAYFVLFSVLKRLFSRKRHVGYFSGFYLISVGIINLAVLVAGSNFKFKNFDFLLLVEPGAFTVFGIWAWVILAKRNLKRDVWNFFAFLLLSMFRFKRFITSADEAGIVSKTFLFSPYFLFRFFLVLLKRLFGEIKISFFDLLYAFGLKNK